MRKFLTSIFFIGFLLTSAYAQDSTAIRIVEEAKQYLGARYKYGASGPDRFDCSGFTGFIYSKFGYKLGRSSSNQAQAGTAVTGGEKSLKMGDIVVFSGSRVSKHPGHVGIFIEYSPDSASFSFIHASTRSGVIISDSDEDYYARRYLCARRILPDSLMVDRAVDTLLAAADTSSADSLSVQRTDASLKTQGSEREPEYYTIKSGDNLYTIAKKKHTTVRALCELNDITPSKILRIGTKLRIK